MQHIITVSQHLMCACNTLYGKSETFQLSYTKNFTELKSDDFATITLDKKHCKRGAG